MIKATWSGIAVSDNRRLIQGKGRMIANPKYTAFKKDMAEIIWAYCMGGNFTGRVLVCLQVSIPPRMDISAIIKAALDAVQLSGCIHDDNQVDILSVERAGKAEGRISTIVFEIEEIK